MPSSTNAGLCPDWIYSDSSNVHVATDRAWFISYTPFPSHLTSLYHIGRPVPVLGVGTIELHAKALPGSFTTWGCSTIELHNVLHVPTYFCNVLGLPLSKVYDISLGGSIHEDSPPSRGGLFLHSRQVAHFQAGAISFLSLAVLPPKGMQFFQSPLNTGAGWLVSAHWPNEERVRWQALRSQLAIDHEPPRYEPPYALHELESVNNRWGSEFRFLVVHRLQISEEADRSEGRRIIRALIKRKDPKAIEVEEMLGVI